MNREVLEYAEMGEEQLSFICNIIENNRPKKIVEIGIAAGGTSVILMDKIESIKNNAVMYSIDKSNTYYRDKSKKTGYLIEQYKEQSHLQIKHKTLTGKYAVEFLEEIGTEIDLLILDTVHTLPGEILDFLACFPYLAENATVIVHDIILNHLCNNPDGYATQVLMNSVVGNKLSTIDINGKYPEIGVFKINEDTHKYLDDVFNAFMITWNYMPDDKQLELYLKWYERFYDKKQVCIFNKAVEFNRNTLENRKNHMINRYAAVGQLIKELKNKNVYIYGNGMYGCIFRDVLSASQINVKGFIISNGQPLQDDSIYFRDALNNKIFEDKNSVLLVGVNKIIQQEIVPIIVESGIINYVIPPEIVFKALTF